MWGDDLESVDWRRLEHHYGTAEDVPGWLRDCASDDPERAATALSQFDVAVYHQGGWICPAAAAALPFLVDLAFGAVHRRAAVVVLIGEFVDEAARVEPEWVDTAWPEALERAAPRLIALLDDPDPAVRREAARVAGTDAMRRPEMAAALRRRWRAEEDRVTRWDLISAFGRFADPDITALLHGLLDDPDPQTGLAAVHALARTEPDLPASRVPQLVAACRGPGIAAWKDSAWFGTSIVDRTGQLLHHDRVAAAEFAVALGDGAGMRQAAVLLAQWRSAAEALHGFLIDRLADEDAETRFQAAYLLACVPSPHAADALAALIDDTANAGTGGHITVSDAAVWALTRLGDARSVQPVRERLAGPHLGFASAGEFFSATPGSWHGFWLPAVDEALSPLTEYAAALVPAVRVGASHALCRLLGAWGAASAPAVPQLVALLGHRHLEVTAATAIGDIGPAAADAADELRRHAPMPAAAWAHWRVTGDPSLALPALARAASEEDLRRLGDLGPLAAGHADRLRRLARSFDHGLVRADAAYTHYRVTADPAVALDVLTEVARPLADGDCRPETITALERLAVIGALTAPVVAIARAVLDSPRRLSYFGGWNVFRSDERLRAAAATVLGNSMARPAAPVE
ncbi:HEAT repeat domain-containing protein [Actinoplanes utahensis]|uniref:PBS lyase n=1 Tax=Actinoplanes utahensis TaxID=1869 RepID=A0A0A6U9F3_ACTUT|nr:HEAT repeat domain-containing protein [Actinoplanes utahensis]KHD72011.1 hypothetical protein MB27_42615 [Actinoplanes utahensis]